MADGGNGALTGQGGSITNTSPTTGIRSGSVTLVSDGTYTNTGHTGGNWWAPTFVGIGSFWSARAVINSQSGTTPSGTFGTFVGLSGSINWSFSNSSAGVEGTGNMTISFSPDGGTTIAGTMTVAWDVGFAP